MSAEELRERLLATLDPEARELFDALEEIERPAREAADVLRAEWQERALAYAEELSAELNAEFAERLGGGTFEVNLDPIIGHP